MKRDAYLQQIESLTENSQLKAEVFRINEQFPDEMTSVSNLSSGASRTVKGLRVTIKTWVNNNLFSFLCLGDAFFSQTGKVQVVRNSTFPKLPRQAFYLYMNDAKNHARATLENPGANRDRRKGILRVEYNTKLDDAKKAPWEERAKIDKERYEREVAEFSGSEWLLQACSDEETTTKKKKNKKKKDPNASLGAISGKLIWWNVQCLYMVYLLVQINPKPPESSTADGDTADTKVAGKKKRKRDNEGGFNGQEEILRKAAALAAKYHTHTKPSVSSTADGTDDTKVAGKKKRERAPPVLPTKTTRAKAPQND